LLKELCREVESRAKNWFEGGSCMVWAEQRKSILLPLPMGVGILREIERQASAVRGELVMARHRCVALMAEYGVDFVNLEYVDRLRRRDPEAAISKVARLAARAVNTVKKELEDAGGVGDFKAEVDDALQPGSAEAVSSEAVPGVSVYRIVKPTETRVTDAVSVNGALEDIAFVAGEWVRCCEDGYVGARMMGELADCIQLFFDRVRMHFAGEGNYVVECEEAIYKQLGMHFAVESELEMELGAAAAGNNLAGAVEMTEAAGPTAEVDAAGETALIAAGEAMDAAAERLEAAIVSMENRAVRLEAEVEKLAGAF